MCNQVHVFEKAGLGKAPFKFLGFEDSSASANAAGMVRKCDPSGVEVWTKPGGSCDYCGNYIVAFCWIQDANGKKFKVGSTCAKKTGDRGLYDPIKREINRERVEKARVRNQARIDDVRKTITRNDVQTALASQPHPEADRNTYFADKTLLDWAIWMLDHAGMSGSMKVVRLVERTVKELDS